jgi:RNA-dependent RNA polymerase
MLNPEEEVNMMQEFVVHCRPSQIKIKYPDNMPSDPAMNCIDLLRCSHMRTPSNLAAETITNLHENGVPFDCFKQLIVDGMEEIVSKLTAWGDPDGQNTEAAMV